MNFKTLLLITFSLSFGNISAQKIIEIPVKSLLQGQNVPIEYSLSNAKVINEYLQRFKGKNIKIQLPAGTYSVGTQIQIPSNTTLSGKGNETVISIHMNFSGTQSYIVNSNYNLGTYDINKGVCIENLIVDCRPNINNARDLMCIFFNKVSDSKISNITIYGALNEAIRIHSNVPGVKAINNSIINCTVDKRGLNAQCIMVSSFTGDGKNESKSPALVIGVNVINCKVTGGDHGIMFFNVKSGIIEGNTCTAQNERGIILSPSVSDVLIKGNKVDSSGSTGIHLAYGAENVTIEANKVTNSVRDMSGVGIEGQGIKAYAGFNNIKIINNICINNATDGIALEGGGNGTGFLISGNSAIGNKRNGIRLWAGEITIQKGGDISEGTIQGNIIEENNDEPIFIGSDNNGLNKVKKTIITKTNVLKGKNGKDMIKQEFSDKSNSILNQ